MRVRTLTGGAVFALGMLSASAALAATSASPDQLSGNWGPTTCSQFTQMDATAQANVITQIGQVNSSSSLTSNSGRGSTNNAGSAASSGTTVASSGNSADSGGTTAGSLGLGAPLTAGQLVAACQAATPTSTLQDAFSKFSSGPNGTSNK